MERFPETEAAREATTEVSPGPRGVLVAMDRQGCHRAGLAVPGTVSVRQR